LWKHPTIIINKLTIKANYPQLKQAFLILGRGLGVKEISEIGLEIGKQTEDEKQGEL
jgi:hypothetical protein